MKSNHLQQKTSNQPKPQTKTPFIAFTAADRKAMGNKGQYRDTGSRRQILSVQNQINCLRLSTFAVWMGAVMSF